MCVNLQIHKVKFENFGTFLEESEISFLLNRRCYETHGGALSCAHEEIYLSPVMAVAGEGSSLSNSIRPLEFVARFIANEDGVSQRNFVGFSTHPLSKKRHCRVDLDFELSGKIYRYVVEFGDGKVYFESLHAKTSRLYSCLFVRKSKVSIAQNYIKIDNFGVTERQLKRISTRMSLISIAAEIGSPQAQEIMEGFSGLLHRSKFSSLLDVMPNDILAAAKIFHENEKLRRQLVSFYVSLESDLVDVVIRKNAYTICGNKRIEVFVPYAVLHKHGNNDTGKELALWALDRTYQVIFVQLSRLLPALDSGSVAIVDGLDRDVDPIVLPSFVDLFVKSATNPKGAQLLFTTHSLGVLKCMRAGQIYLMSGSRY